MKADTHDAGIRPIHVTFFRNEYAPTLETKNMTLRDLRDLVLTTKADKKENLRLLKLAKFGPTPSENNCLRYDDNIIALSGVVVEHDAETMSLDDALARLRAVPLTALVYTSPSHTPERPRWRVVAPTSDSWSPAMHGTLVARLNGVLGGVLKEPESFVLSQPYYFGKVGNNPHHRAEYTSGDYINLRFDLDAGAINKKPPKTKVNNIQLSDVAGVRPDAPITSLKDDRLKSLRPAVKFMIENAKPPEDASDKVRRLKGGRGHCFVVNALIEAGLNNAQIKAVYRLGKIANGPAGHSRRFDGYVERVIAYCRSAPQEAADKPTPLFPPLPPSMPYPTQALGGTLAKAAFAIARKVQVPEAIAAQSVLAAAALAAQAHANVRMPYGQIRPLSLYLLTIAETGARKSSADNEALWPIRKHEKNLALIHDEEFKRWSVNHAAWTAEKRKIENTRQFTLDTRKAALNKLGPAPEQPLHPFLTAPDPTIEGLIKAWAHAPAALGIFTAEGGQFIGGHGMSTDHRLKTASSFSSIWDGTTIKRIRAADGVMLLPGRRLSMHLMVQPETSAAFFEDPILRDQGMLSRILVAAPDSIAGRRFYRETETQDEAAIHAYGASVLKILEMPYPLAEGQRNELDPPALAIAPDATQAWIEFYNSVERRCGSSNELCTIGDFAAKAAEQAVRIAGVLTVYHNPDAAEIDAGAMGNAILIGDWYIGETLRLRRAARTDARLIRAQRLLEWLQERGPEINVREIIQFGPAPERSKIAADETLAILQSHGWVRVVSKRPYRISVIRVARSVATAAA